MFSVGSLVRLRGRDWIVLPQSEAELLILRPLGGTDDETTAVMLGDIQLGYEKLSEGQFVLPTVDHIGNHQTTGMLRDAIKLGLRSSAGPFRSFGHLAVEPRPYQLVPLLMALRLNPVRLLIADDVGIGKTIEAGLILRELIDRNEVRAFSVLCPPHLAEQWQTELRNKFHIEAELVLSSTATRLERVCRVGESLFMYYPYTIVSTDFIKSDRRRAEFLNHASDCIIIDEAHTVAHSIDKRAGKHQRYELVKQLAQKNQRHLILVTATPHSGKDDAFRALLALLKPEFADLPDDLRGEANEKHRRELAKYFIQRRRADILQYADSHTPFPQRDQAEVTYSLTPAYRQLFERVVAYARQTVRNTGDDYRYRVRWWSALALLRSLASSPAAAAETLRNRAVVADTETDADTDDIGERAILDVLVEDTSEMMDVAPGGDYWHVDNAEKRLLGEMAKEAEALMNAEADQKLAGVIQLVRQLLHDGHMPIVFCRFIPTVDYVAKALRQAIHGVEIGAVTGLFPPSEREHIVNQLIQQYDKRVLVCTDCLSEGINLQEGFDAVIHYDLSWNPTRHEQREGRIDRYGQRRPRVKVITYYGEDNQIDGIVLKVLLRKHEAIRKTLGISIPVPMPSTEVMEAIFEQVLKRDDTLFQTSLPGFEAWGKPIQQRLDLQWDTAAEREKTSRTLFAQRTIRPDEVMAEWHAVQNSIGTAVDVRRFLQTVIEAYGGQVIIDKHQAFKFDLSPLPEALRQRLEAYPSRFTARFEPPVQAHDLLLTRTHPLVETISQYILETALENPTESIASRCGVIYTHAVEKRTTLLLLRLRYHIHTRFAHGDDQYLLAEECLTVAFAGSPDNPTWLTESDFLLQAEPTRNIGYEQKRDFIQRVIDAHPTLTPHLNQIANDRAQSLLQAHQRIRHTPHITYAVEPQLPVDIIGIYVYLPDKQGESNR
jgi:ERCC4-related helicase